MKLSQITIDSIYSLRNDGRTHAQIAKILGIAEKTVWTYLKKKRIQDAIMKSDLPRYVDEYNKSKSHMGISDYYYGKSRKKPRSLELKMIIWCSVALIAFAIWKYFN